MKGQGICPDCESERRKAGLMKNGQIHPVVHPYTFEEAVEKATKIHGNLYKYIDIYQDENGDSVLIIECEIHGVFHHKVRYHIGEGNGCKDCAKIGGVYNLTQAERHKESWLKQSSHFYTLLCFSEDEKFYKVGVAKHGVKRRYAGVHKLPYKYKIVLEEPISRYEAVIKEQTILRENINKSYRPIKSFRGETECLTEISHINLDKINLEKLTIY